MPLWAHITFCEDPALRPLASIHVLPQTREVAVLFKMEEEPVLPSRFVVEVEVSMTPESL